MSHMTKIQVEIRDLTALENACRALGLELRRDLKHATYFAHQKYECDAVIIVPTSAFSIGVVKESNGAYSLHADFFGMEGERLIKKCGKNLSLIVQRYGVEKAKIEARKKGYMVHERKELDGTIRLVLRRFANA